VISIFSPFLLFSHDFIIYTLILPVLQLQKQHVMSSQTRSHIEYVTQIYNIFVLILYSKLFKKSSLTDVLNTI